MKRNRMIVADNDLFNREAMAIIFSDEYEVVTASSALELQDLLEKENDLRVAVIDLDLKGGNAREIVNGYRIIHGNDIMVLYVSACSSLQLSLQEHEWFLSKPFKKSDLLKVFRGISDCVSQEAVCVTV